MPTKTAPAPAPRVPKLMTTRELANLLGVPRSTVLAWRTRGKGPRAYAFGRELRFAEADVAAWLETQREDAR